MQEAEDLLAGIDELDATGLGAALTRYEVKAPDTKNDISAPFAFNLMFRTSIGPKGDATGYLRPETAQGIFVNFRCGHCARPWMVDSSGHRQYCRLARQVDLAAAVLFLVREIFDFAVQRCFCSFNNPGPARLPVCRFAPMSARVFCDE